MSDCPVCGKIGVDRSATRCPQCHADLECFALLDALEEPTPESAAQTAFKEVGQTIAGLGEDLTRGRGGREQRRDRPVLIAIAGVALLMVVLQLPLLERWYAERPALDGTPEPGAMAAGVEAVADRLDQLSDGLAALEGRLDGLVKDQTKAIEQVFTAAERMAKIGGQVQGSGERLARLPATPISDTRDSTAEETAVTDRKEPELVFHHHLRRGDTLWSIAKRYYGRGQLYPVLIVQNPGLGPYHLGTGILRILADRDEAAEVYRRITPPGAEGRLFRYRVQPGDDWHALAARFLGRSSRAPELIALNPNRELKPGEQVLIALE